MNLGFTLFPRKSGIENDFKNPVCYQGLCNCGKTIQNYKLFPHSQLSFLNYTRQDQWSLGRKTTLSSPELHSGPNESESEARGQVT